MCAPHALRVSYRAVARARTQSIAQSVVLLQVCTARRQRCCGGCVDAVAATRAAPRARQVGASRGGPRLAARFVPTLAFMRRLGRFVAVCMTGDILVRGRALASACDACSPMGHAQTALGKARFKCSSGLTCVIFSISSASWIMGVSWVGWAQMRVWGVMALEREPWLEYAARARCCGLSLRLVDLYPAPGMSVSKSAAWCSWGRCCGVSGAWRMRVMT